MILAALDRAMVGSWARSMNDEGLSPSRIRQAHQCLSAILEQAVDDDLIGRNPARRVELPRLNEPHHRFLTAEQVARLAPAMPDAQHHTVVYLLAYGGLRWGELAALRRSGVEPLAVALRSPKRQPRSPDDSCSEPPRRIRRASCTFPPSSPRCLPGVSSSWTTILKRSSSPRRGAGRSATRTHDGGSGIRHVKERGKTL